MSIIYHDSIEQGSPEWMRLRCGSLGASRVKDALAGGTGATRKKLMYQLAAESITGEKESFFQTAAMAEGIRREPESRSFFEFESGITLAETGLITNDDFPGCHVSPDGINKDLQIGFEVKNPSAAVHVEYLLKGKLPAVYAKQVYMSLLVTGYNKWIFMSYCPKLKPLIVEVMPDKKILSEMTEGIKQFIIDMECIKHKIS